MHRKHHCYYFHPHRSVIQAFSYRGTTAGLSYECDWICRIRLIVLCCCNRTVHGRERGFSMSGSRKNPSFKFNEIEWEKKIRLTGDSEYTRDRRIYLNTIRATSCEKQQLCGLAGQSGSTSWFCQESQAFSMSLILDPPDISTARDSFLIYRGCIAISLFNENPRLSIAYYVRWNRPLTDIKNFSLRAIEIWGFLCRLENKGSSSVSGIANFLPNLVYRCWSPNDPHHSFRVVDDSMNEKIYFSSMSKERNNCRVVFAFFPAREQFTIIHFLLSFLTSLFRVLQYFMSSLPIL